VVKKIFWVSQKAKHQYTCFIEFEKNSARQTNTRGANENLMLELFNLYPRSGK